MPLAPVHTTRKRRPVPKQKRLRQLVVSLEVGCCIGVLVLFLYAFYHYTVDSPRYKVNDVLLFGGHEVTLDEVRAVAGVTTEDNLLLISTAAVEARLAKLPYVKEVSVSRELPDTLIITLKERDAVATVMAGRRSFLVDGDAYVLRELSVGEPVTGLLITNLPDLGTPVAGEHLESATLHEALALWRAYSGTSVSDEVALSEISAENPTQLTMFWDEIPYEVRWGRSDYETQAIRLSALWRKKEGQLPCQEYLDLRFEQDLPCR